MEEEFPVKDDLKNLTNWFVFILVKVSSESNLTSYLNYDLPRNIIGNSKTNINKQKCFKKNLQMQRSYF